MINFPFLTRVIHTYIILQSGRDKALLVNSKKKNGIPLRVCVQNLLSHALSFPPFSSPFYPAQNICVHAMPFHALVCLQEKRRKKKKNSKGLLIIIIILITDTQ